MRNLFKIKKLIHLEDSKKTWKMELRANQCPYYTHAYDICECGHREPLILCCFKNYPIKINK